MGAIIQEDGKELGQMKIEFIKDWKSCHKEGSIRDVTEHFAIMLIETGYAKAVDRPPRHKMIEKADKEKRHYYVG